MQDIDIYNLIKKNYKINKIIKIITLNSGQAKVFEIITGKERYILKLYDSKNSVVNLLKIKETIRLLLFLKERKFTYRLPIPLITADGDYIINFKSYNGILYKKINGNIPKKLNVSLIKEIAKLQAEFHKITKDFKINQKIIRFHKFVKSVRDFENYYKIKEINNKDNGLFTKNLEFIKRSKDLAYSKLDHKSINGVVHSDLNQYNIIIFKNKINGLIDFENYNYAPRILDIAYTIKMTCFKKGKLDISCVRSYLKSYSEIYALPKNYDKTLLPAILFDNSIYFLRAYKKGKTKELKETISTSKEIYRIMNSRTELRRFVTILKRLH